MTDENVMSILSREYYKEQCYRHAPHPLSQLARSNDKHDETMAVVLGLLIDRNILSFDAEFDTEGE